MVDLTRLEKSRTTEDDEKDLIKAEAVNYLLSTDWYVLRLIETQKPIPEDVVNKRSIARTNMNK